MEKKLKTTYKLYIVLFVVLNILNTFVVTTHKLNRYIVPFDYSFLGIANSIIGNAAVIIFFMLLLGTILKKPKSRVIGILVATFLLNFLLFWSNIFNRYYGTSFSIRTLSMFKNPPEGFGLSIAFEAFKELITYYRIILFIPTFVIAILAYRLIKNNIGMIDLRKYKIKNVLSKFFLILILSMINLNVFTRSVENTEVIESAMPTYATQNIGIYQFYFLELVGFDHTQYAVNNNQDEVKEVLDSFNKNKDSYTNIIDGKTYDYNVLKRDISDISGSLIDNLNDDDSINGLLEDYNLVLIHLESFNHFLLEVEETRLQLPNLTAILEESYVFNNFYTNVGIGNSFDAEIAVLTGLNANGTSTLAWEFDEERLEKNFNFQTIPKLFNKEGYKTVSTHGNTNLFYNRGIVHPKMFGFNEMYFREEFITNNGFLETEVTEALDYLGNLVNHHAGAWVSDRLVFKNLNDQIKELTNRDEQFMMYAISILPHTPYLHDPYHETTESTLYPEKYLSNLDNVTIRYINYLKYYNEVFRSLFEDVNGYGDDYVFDEANLYNHKKTAFLFYGDHGSGISNGDISKLLKTDLDALEERQELLQTIAFLYVPGETIGEHNFREGLIKGNQDLVRGQTDLFRTIIDLFNLETKSNDYIFGVNGFSNEPAYSIDNRTGDVVTDDVFFSLRNSYYNLINLEYDIEKMSDLKDEIIKFKLASDNAVNGNLFRKFRDEDFNLVLNSKSYRTKI